MKERKNMNRPLLVYILWILIGLQSISGLAGGIIMLIDPTGQSLRLPAIFLMGTPFDDYLVPGIFLVLFLGLLPLLSLVGLMGLRLGRIRLLNIYPYMHWGWTFALYTAIALILWMDIQVFYVGYWDEIQTYNALTGVLILIFTLLPQVVEYYRLEKR
jgi:hypothetical protein